MSDTTHKENPTFHLGLTMAGAVSAGCYTAGVIDYLFEILDLWEKAKKGEMKTDYNENITFDKALVPQHNVIIEAMGGTSAGGMTTMMTGLYSLGNKINPVRTPLSDPYEAKNILYDSWVHLDDKKVSGNSFASLWDKSDIPNNSSTLQSVFNTQAIDNIADRAYQYYPAKASVETELKDRVAQLPSYISKRLEILLSHTVLRGIPLEVDFSTFKQDGDLDIPTHTSYEHNLITHYSMNYGDQVNTNKYFWFNPFESNEMEKMKLSTIATGAFPIGLKYRTFVKGHFSSEYMKSILKRSIFADFSDNDPDPDNRLIFRSLPNDYETNTVDGGAVNNEPYGEVVSIVRNRVPVDLKNETGSECERQIEREKQRALRYGVIMIDPFPDMVNSEEEENFELENDLPGVMSSTFTMLREQSKLKRKEMIDHLSHDYVKGQIYPKRHYYYDNGAYRTSDDYPIASSSFEAFGGFLDIKFRVHDFFLGRNNARNFFRYFFSLPEDNPLFDNWTDLQKKVFGFDNKINGKTVKFLPIIPDLRLLTRLGFDGPLTPEHLQRIDHEAYTFSGIEKKEYTITDRPKYDPNQLFDLEPSIISRFKQIISIIEKRGEQPAKKHEKPTPIADRWLESRYKTGWFGHFKSKIFNWLIFSGMAKNAAAGKISEGIIKLIIKDLDKKELLQKRT